MMNSRSRRVAFRFSAVALCLAAVVGFADAACVRACPFCPGLTLTLSEQYAKADAAVLVEWVAAETPKKESPGSTKFQIVQSPRTPFQSLARGKPLTLSEYHAGKVGNLFLLFGTLSKGESIEWSTPLAVTETSYQYVIQAPPPESAAEKRLAYFLRFLEFPDPTVADDAYGEFANAPYQDITPLASRFPREKLRKWLADPEVPPSRLGLYGLLLGLCGNAEDAELMAGMIVRQPDGTDAFRLGIDGVMGGYLLLAGEKGLELIERTKFADKKSSFSETFSAMQALRFLWTYGDGRIAPARLKQSLHTLLDRPELADIVIADLARWKDWSLHERLMSLYGARSYDLPTVKRAIIRYMIACTKDTGTDAAAENQSDHVAVATACLKELRKRDPKLVGEAERLFFLQ